MNLLHVKRLVVRVFIVIAFSFFAMTAYAGDLSTSTNTNAEKAYRCAVHVHSKISNSGRYSLPEITDWANLYGLDVVFLTDNRTDTIQYGLAPLRNILWLSKTRSCVMKTGPQSYLEEIESENKRQSDVLYVPGVEVCPRFYWTGSVFQNPTCHDHQKNLMVLGVKDKDVIAGIPEVCGYSWPKDAAWIILSRLILILLCIAFVSYLALPSYLSRHTGYSRRQMRRSLLKGIIVPLIIIAIVFNVCASLVASFDVYGKKPESKNGAQNAVDFIMKHNLVSYWAHPEAFDDQELEYYIRGICRFPFDVHTDPYPEILDATTGYTGFGGVYEDKNNLIEAGGLWDEILMEYIRGRRKNPAWCFGEMLYHYEGQAGKKLGNVETVIWAENKSQDSLLNSIRAGRFYARRNSGNQRLSLDEFKLIKTDDGLNKLVSKITSSIPGERVKIQVVRNGSVIHQKEENTPVTIELKDDLSASRSSCYYRVFVSGAGPLKLVANPIFSL